MYDESLGLLPDFKRWLRVVVITSYLDIPDVSVQVVNKKEISMQSTREDGIVM